MNIIGSRMNKIPVTHGRRHVLRASLLYVNLTKICTKQSITTSIATPTNIFHFHLNLSDGRSLESLVVFNMIITAFEMLISNLNRHRRTESKASFIIRFGIGERKTKISCMYLYLQNFNIYTHNGKSIELNAISKKIISSDF